MRSKNSLLILLFVLYQIKILGQVPRSEVNCPTPEIASLGTYGNVPVSLYTGQPNISIPLYEIKEGSISVPISLDYHLASVKPNRHTGWVGLGWVLSSGGYITRNVRGLMDEKKYENGLSTYSGYASGFYAHRSKLNNINNINTLKTYGNHAQANAGEEYELMADEFSFNFCGYSGNFYLNKDGGWTVISDHDIKIVFNEDDGFINKSQLHIYADNWYYRYCDRFFNKFTLITPDGLRYTFGGNANNTNVDAVEYSISYYRQNISDLIPTSWYLTKIETPEGRTVTFTYAAGDPVCELKYSPFYKEKNNIVCNYDYPITSYKALSGYLQFPVYLTAINTASEIISFHSFVDDSGKPNAMYLIPSESTKYPEGLASVFDSPGNVQENFCTFFKNINDNVNVYQMKNAIREKINWRLLHAISIKYNNSFAKTYYFQYDFQKFNKILAALTERNGTYEECGFTTLPPYPSNYTPREYHFTYHNMSDLFSNPTLNKEDSWGYYNSNATYTFSTTVDEVISGKPYSSLTYTKAGTLQSIQYPTGGKTVFEYELNKYSKFVNPSFTTYTTENYNSTGGGLRISKITSYTDENTVAQIKKYYYTTDSVPGDDTYPKKSSGILKRKPVYECLFKAQNSQGNFYYSPPEGNAELKIKQSEGFLMQTTNDNTPFIGYSSVIEQTLDANGNSNGYVRYQFSNYDEDVWGETHLDESFLYSNVTGNDNYANPFSSRAQERGKLMAEDYYDASGNLKKSIRNHYKPSDENYFLTINQEVMFFCSHPATYQFSTMLYAFRTYTYSYLLDKQTVREYQNNDNVIQTETQYSYNSRKLLSTTTVLRSDGIKQTTKLVYPFEIIEGADAAVMQKMTAKNMLSEYVEKVSYLENGKVIDGEYRKYKEFIANFLIKPEKIYLLPKTGSTTFNNLYPSSATNISLYLESGMHPPDIISMTDAFTIRKYPTKVKISMLLNQQSQYINYFPLPICFVIRIKKSDGTQIYEIEASDNVYGRYDNYYYIYERADEIELQPGTYIAELTHRGRFNSDFTYLNVGHWGWLQISGIEKSPTMALSYSMLKPEISYKYNSKGNIIEARHEGSQISTAYIWGYNYQYPIAEIKNASYAEVKTALNYTNDNQVEAIAAKSAPTYYDWILIESLQTNLPNSQVTIYKYKPSIGIQSVTSPNGATVYYQYDELNRLKTIKDHLGNIIQQNDYKYHN
jgi:hypothetical protein